MNAFLNNERRGSTNRRSGADRRGIDDPKHSGSESEQDRRAPQTLDKAVRLKPDLAEIWNQKGEGFVSLRHYDDAKEAFNVATRIKPKIAPAWYNLASLYSIEGEKKEALANLKKAIKIDPNFKRKAKEDINFKKLLRDEDFKKFFD